MMVLPELDDLQRNPERVEEWIDYCTLDTVATWELRELLEDRLKKKAMGSEILVGRGRYRG